MSTEDIIDKDEVLKMARHIANTFGTRMCDENGDTHGEELYAMGIDDIVNSVKLVAAAERERIKQEQQRCYVNRGEA